ncbi:hypothetical protein OU415_22185 [Saccharopolyspora sp. WRP15-2]|uniref:Flp pilus-assembly TadG-like N-terminal domain-containing protein n=1 Tax=Saccharopolyspora oryzae TaxID=2997343 RepID=A0ABT4V2I1_9PSEU|nr:hypothetical protein [Saccharopolyspora oryzae]MDA3628160.1 hypothetical protein [Saccharopolyspora oryzae]
MTALILGLLLIGLLGVPVAAVVAGETSYDAGLRAAAAAAATRHQVDATVLSPPTPDAVETGTDVKPQRYSAEVRWTGADGAPHFATASVAPSTVVGSAVPLWVDTSDRLSTPPRSERQIHDAATGTAFGAWAAGEVVCIALIAGARAAGEALGIRSWAREWEVVGPKWTRRQQY